MSLIDTINSEGLVNVVTRLFLKNKAYDDERVFVLNYHQTKSPKEGIANECRGIILQEQPDYSYKIICRPFDRFFNIGAVPYDFTDISVYEKLDGSLIKIYFFNNNWQIATRGSAFGENEQSILKKSFKSLAINAFGLSNNDEFQASMVDMRQDLTYCLEYISPDNLILTKYDRAGMVFLAARHTESGDPIEITSFPNATLPKIYPLNTHDECTIALETLKEDEEGFVIKNNLGILAKLKSPRYLAIAYKPKEKPQKVVSYEDTLILAVVHGEAEEFSATNNCQRAVNLESLVLKEIETNPNKMFTSVLKMAKIIPVKNVFFDLPFHRRKKLVEVVSKTLGD